jgi:ADP-heptose:LPS heptosyltransferase
MQLAPMAPMAPLEQIERVAVFRALVLGDMLCATPALRALRAACPGAQITLVGLPWAAALAERLDSVDDFIALPGHPGLPEVPADVRALPGFLQAVQERRFDLALQMHGSGAIVNPLVASFGARATAGFCDGRNWVPPQDRTRYTDWPERGHEIERLLALTDHLGCARQGLGLDFPLTAADRAAARDLLAELPAGSAFAVVHAGAQLASRRWPVARFAELAWHLRAQGLQLVLTGGPGEAALVAELQHQLQGQALNLAGRTSLWTLGAVVAQARCVVCNDTGISHIAAALGRPSLVLSCGSDVRRWAPLDADRHRVLWHDLPCRPCAFAECPYDHGCAQSLTVDAARQALGHLLLQALPA